MKGAYLLLLLSIFGVSCNQNQGFTDKTAATEQETKNPQIYGAAFTPEHILQANELTSKMSGKDSIQATVKAEVLESCQAKGCWMDVKMANSSMKVTFRNYGFFLPIENLQEREVIFTGTAKRELISVEDQRHYAKDAGKTDAEIAAITTPAEELRFVADGVILK